MGKQYGFVIDTANCYGCHTCSLACKSENMTPNGVAWRKVREHITQSPNSISFISMACNHCDDPQCLKVCPASTYSKHPEYGAVVQAHEKCIGCQMCIMACPYKAPAYDAARGKTSKCDMCVDRLDKGQLPRCVDSCPGGVLKFGEISELRKQYPTNWQELEARFGMPDHTISRPNVVIIAKSQ